MVQRFFLYGTFALFTVADVWSQQPVQDTIKPTYIIVDGDTIFEQEQLQEVIVSRHKLDQDALRQYLLLQSRVYRVYPYARIASERLTVLNKNLALLKTTREKKKYLSIVEDYMNNEFEAQLKKLSRKQGQILVKLIYRQTGHTTFDLIKEFKSSWRAFWYNNTGKVFDIDIKAKYDPFSNNEDFLIETVLVRAFQSGRLIEQSAKNPVNYDILNNYWEEKAARQNKN